jgi:mRNA interferase RelE/StbE
MPVRIEWHPATEADLRKLDPVVRKRIVNAVERLGDIDDPRQRLVAYVESLRGYWKLRVGDYRVVCDLQRAADDQLVLESTWSTAARPIWQKACAPSIAAARTSAGTPRRQASP